MSPSPKHLQLDRQLCFALYRASRAVIRAYGPLLEPLGITYPQYLALLVLWDQDDLTVKEVGEKLALDSATLTPLLKKLEAKKLLTRQRSESDERVVRIKLTRQGIALQTKALTFPEKIANAVGASISDPAAISRILSLKNELDVIALGCKPATSS